MIFPCLQGSVWSCSSFVNKFYVCKYLKTSLGGSRLSVSCTIQQIIEQTLATNFLPMAPSVCLLLCHFNGGNINTGLPPVLSVTQLQKEKNCFFCARIQKRPRSLLFKPAGFLYAFIFAPYNHPPVFRTKKTPNGKMQTQQQQCVDEWFCIVQDISCLNWCCSIGNLKGSKGQLKVLTLGVFSY